MIDSEKLNQHLREMNAEYMEKSREVLPDGTETEGGKVPGSGDDDGEEGDLSGAEGDYPAVQAFVVGEKKSLSR